MKIGVYGGTFDPPHLGHMEAARAVMEVLDLDRLLFVPAKLPPHKQLPEGGASPQQRMEMTALMADALGPKTEVLDLELNRPGKSFTSDTLAELRESYPQDELWLLMGSDMFRSVHTWHEPEKIMALAKIAAFARTEEDDGASFAVQSAYLAREFGAEVSTIALPKINEISSTQLRKELAKGAGREQLWAPVYGYILKNKLYGTNVDLKQLSNEDLRCVSWSMVRAKRLAHIRGTEEEAVRLAKRWGADPEQARRAAILHDCTKYWTLEEQLDACRLYGIELDELEQVAVKLLHSKTGAALAQYVFGEEEAVCSAIFSHTTGKPGMNTLEKVIYLADYMEPNRDFDGVEALRKLAYEDLDQAMILGLTMSKEEMEERGVPLHGNSLAALEELRGK